MARRVQTEQVFDERGHLGEEGDQYDLDALSDEGDLYGAEDDYGNENEAQPPAGNEGGDDLINYKGIYFNDDPGQKYTDPESGAHFEYKDMCRRINRVMQKRGETETTETVVLDSLLQNDPGKHQQ